MSLIIFEWWCRSSVMINNKIIILISIKSSVAHSRQIERRGNGLVYSNFKKEKKEYKVKK